MNETATVYQLRIALAYIEPSVWRRLEVPSTMTFGDLHGAIQAAMGWEEVMVIPPTQGEGRVDFSNEPMSQAAPCGRMTPLPWG